MMSLVLTDEQEMLAESARAWVDDRAPLSALRTLRASRSNLADGMWASAAEMGWAGLAIPQDFGGLGLGLAEAAIVAEALGRNLVQTPLIPTCVVAAGVLAELGDPDGWLARIAEGAIVVPVTSDGPIALAAEADALLVLSDEHWRIVTEGWTSAVVHRADHRFPARIDLGSATGSAVGADNGAWERSLACARVIEAAEMLGGAQAVFDLTLAYLSERHQFGRPIGSFQALQHRAARMFIEVELLRGAVLTAARADVSEREGASIVARVTATDVFRLCTAEAVQMHGGIGMTDECDVGFFLKRAQVTGTGSYALRRSWLAAKSKMNQPDN
jgi:alkylation response protein AidB-like acyl-CoA dehydrogenase